MTRHLTEAQRHVADALDLQHALVEAAAAALATARGCAIEEARERLARELRVIAAVRDVAGRQDPW